MGYDRNDYLRRFGHDIEMAERQKKLLIEAKINQWLSYQLNALNNREDMLEDEVKYLSSSDDLLLKLARKATIYQITSGAIDGNRWDQTVRVGAGMFVSGSSYFIYQALLEFFFNRQPMPCTFAQAVRAIRQKTPLFRQEGVLNMQECGIFWQRIMVCLPPYYDGIQQPIELTYLEEALGDCHDMFYRDSGSIKQALDNAFKHHWKQYTEKQRTALEDAVRRCDFSQPNTLREFFIFSFPEAVSCWDRKELSELQDEGELLSEVYSDDPETGMRMWRFLLDTAQEHLGEPYAARHLLSALLFSAFYGEEDLLQPLVQELKNNDHDEHLARQLFQNAYVSKLQELILHTCIETEELELWQKLLNLLEQNPFPHDSIEIDPAP